MAGELVGLLKCESGVVSYLLLRILVHGAPSGHMPPTLAGLRRYWKQWRETRFEEGGSVGGKGRDSRLVWDVSFVGKSITTQKLIGPPSADRIAH